MLILLSPAKSLNYQETISFKKTSDLIFPNETKELVDNLCDLSISDIMDLMQISEKLATLNFHRYQNFYQNQKEVKKQAIFAFNGDVYDGLQAKLLDLRSLHYLQKHLKILSGLYGILEPFNNLTPYRLEMGVKLSNTRGKDLYSFWKEKITSYFNALSGNLILNLASREYSSVIDFARLNKRVISVVFKDLDRNGNYKIITFYSKLARGLFTRFMAENKIKKVKDLKSFDKDGYYFSNSLSTENYFVFLRDFKK